MSWVVHKVEDPDFNLYDLVQHQPTHQMMQAHILHWVCAIQRTEPQRSS